MVQHLLCAPWELDQISEPVRMTQCYCCNVPPQWCVVSNARNFIPHHGKWTPRTSSGQGNPKNMVLRATNKCCSRFIPKLLTQVSLDKYFPTENTPDLSLVPQFYRGTLDQTWHTGNIFVISKGKQTGCLDKAPNKRLMTQMDI